MPAKTTVAGSSTDLLRKQLANITQTLSKASNLRDSKAEKMASREPNRVTTPIPASTKPFVVYPFSSSTLGTTSRVDGSSVGSSNEEFPKSGSKLLEVMR